MRIDKCVVIGLNNIYFDYLELNSNIKRIDLYIERKGIKAFIASLSGTQIKYVKTINIDITNSKMIIFEVF